MQRQLEELDRLLFEAADAKRAFNAFEWASEEDSDDLIRIATRWHKAGMELTQFLQQYGDSIMRHWAQRQFSLGALRPRSPQPPSTSPASPT